MRHINVTACGIHCYRIFLNEQPLRLLVSIMALRQTQPVSLCTLVCGGGRDFSAPVQTDPGAHTASCTMGTGSLFPGVKRTRRGVNYPFSSIAEVKERVELYIYSPSELSWSLPGRILLFIFRWYNILNSARVNFKSPKGVL